MNDVTQIETLEALHAWLNTHDTGPTGCIVHIDTRPHYDRMMNNETANKTPIVFLNRCNRLNNIRAKPTAIFVEGALTDTDNRILRLRGKAGAALAVWTGA